MAIQAYTPIPPAPEPPDRTDRATFNSRARDWAEYQKETLVPGVNDALANIMQNATHAQDMAGQAGVYAQDAASRLTDVNNAASAVMASANYKGLWSSLAGPLALPATVSHHGRQWFLKVNLADVTAQEPALGSAYWGEVSHNDYIPLTAPSGITLAVDRGYYGLAAPGSVLQLPPDPWHGFVTGAYNRSGSRTPYLDRNGKTICGVAENYLMNLRRARILLMFDANTDDWFPIDGVATYAPQAHGQLRQKVVQVPFPAFSASTDKSAAVAHGIARTQVRGLSIVANATGGVSVGPDYSTNTALKYAAYLDDANANVYVLAGQGASLAGASATFTILYEG